MSGKTRAFFLLFSTVALIAFSAVGTIPVYADDGTSTGSTEETTTTTETDQGDTATEEAPVEEAAPPLLEQLPDNTTVTIVDETGEALPLASQDSAEAVQMSDPVWCPEGQSPGGDGCTPSFGSFAELLVYLQANDPDQAGTIFVQQGAYVSSEESIVLDANNFTNMDQHNLTVTGGWNTSDNSIDPAGTQFTIPIIIGSSSNPWAGSLTLNNIFISGVDDQTGLTLNSQGNISLTNVGVTDSQSGAELNAGGNVTINNSKFNNNKKAGAKINAGGNVDITTAEFSGNQYSYYDDGWHYEGTGLDVTAQVITLNGVLADGNNFGANLQGANVFVSNSSFSGNTSGWSDPIGYGLNVNSTGAVTLAGVNANDNQVYGANILAGSSVLISNSHFNGNQSYYWWGDKTYYGYGLQVVTNADIALLTVTADGNYLLGAHLEGADIAVRDSSFSNNSSGSGLDVIGGGLEIVGITDPVYGEGNVALRNVIADNNQVFGANIQTTGEVAINTGSFSGQITYVYDANSGEISEIGGGYGLQIVTDGNIALRSVTATGNYQYGASLTGNNVDISTSVFSNNGSGVNTLPVGYGVKVNSKGAVSILDITANENQLYGADIVAVGNISIQTGFFSGHQAVVAVPCQGLVFYGYGLTAVSQQGDVTLNGVQANYNNLWGASLEGNSVFVTNSQFNNNVSDSNQFIDDTGLIIKSHGDQNFVFLDNVEAKENRLIGATITADGGVVIWNSTFTGNAGITCTVSWCPVGSEIYHGYGLSVVTPGIISLDLVNASDNHLYGAHLEGSTVNISNSSFNNNGTGAGNTPLGRGLDVISSGTVTINLVEANNNQNYGANIQAVGDVTVTASDFAGNYHVVGSSPVGYGLQVVTLGNITLNSDNTGYGIQSYQNGSGAILQGNNVTVIDSNFYNNGSGNGLTINATGNVTLTNVTATANGQNGVAVTSPACAIVQVNGGTFSNNGQYGLSVEGGLLTLDGTQTFANNVAGNVFQNPATCVIVLSAAPLSAGSTLVASSVPAATISAGTTTNSTTTVSNNSKKTAKIKKAHVKKHKIAKVRPARRAR